MKLKFAEEVFEEEKLKSKKVLTLDSSVKEGPPKERKIEKEKEKEKEKRKRKRKKR